MNLRIIQVTPVVNFSAPNVQAHGHGHSHDEDVVKAQAKHRWSKEANTQIQEDEILEEDIIDLPPQRGPQPKVNHGHSHEGHGHGHSHGGHGHSHGGHGHSHGGHGHSHGPPQPELTPEEREKARQRLHKNWDDDDDEEVEGSNVWRNALGATFLISIFPFIILFTFDIFPYIRLDNSEEKKWLMNRILAFASGGLLGDAFLHLIPHASMASGGDDGHGHGHSHGGHGHSHGGHGHSHDGGEHEPHDLSVGLGVLSGIVAFLCVEKLVRILNAGQGHGHSHGHSHVVTKDDKAKKDDKKKEENKDKSENEDKKEKKDKSKEDKSEKEEESSVNISGVLNLVADAFHNFTDGLAIGASFMAGNPAGWTTTVVILFHEIPHEIGDYAILVQSGVPPLRAKAMQLVTAVAAMFGCFVALFAQSAGQAAATAFILPFTAGGFIYIATVSVIPGLLEGSSLRQSFWEIFCLGIGVYSMVIIAAYE